ncbi:MAG: hypothetical protein INR71_00690 [Terriglobus roseus]|nr:hypothetical protein [Terriglobus roseus]
MCDALRFRSSTASSDSSSSSCASPIRAIATKNSFRPSTALPAPSTRDIWPLVWSPSPASLMTMRTPSMATPPSRPWPVATRASNASTYESGTSAPASTLFTWSPRGPAFLGVKPQPASSPAAPPSSPLSSANSELDERLLDGSSNSAFCFFWLRDVAKSESSSPKSDMAAGPEILVAVDLVEPPMAVCCQLIPVLSEQDFQWSVEEPGSAGVPSVHHLRFL